MNLELRVQLLRRSLDSFFKHWYWRPRSDRNVARDVRGRKLRRLEPRVNKINAGFVTWTYQL